MRPAHPEALPTRHPWGPRPAAEKIAGARRCGFYFPLYPMVPSREATKSRGGQIKQATLSGVIWVIFCFTLFHHPTPALLY
jgi:hypothetical protein